MDIILTNGAFTRKRANGDRDTQRRTLIGGQSCSLRVTEKPVGAEAREVSPAQQNCVHAWHIDSGICFKNPGSELLLFYFIYFVFLTPFIFKAPSF